MRPPAPRGPRGRKRTAFFAAAALVLAAAPSRAQIPGELDRRPLASIVIDGDGGVLDPSALELPVGAPVDRAALRALVQRLLASGRWADVQVEVAPEGRGVRVFVRLTPRALLTRIDVFGNSVVDTSDLLRELHLSAGMELDPGALGTFDAKARALYAERGYEQARLEHELRDTDDPARKVLILRIAEGAPTRIRRVVLDGDPLPARWSTRRTLGVAEGDVLEARTLEDALQAGEAELRAEGWLEAALGPFEIRRSEAGVDVVVRSRIGPRYELAIRGNEPFSRSAIEETLSLGDERLVAGAEATLAARVEDFYRRRGFPDARVRVWRGAPDEAATDREAFDPTLLGQRRRGRVTTAYAPERAALRVEIRPGVPLVVLSRRYPGAAHFEGSFLDNQIATYLQEIVDESGLFDPVDVFDADQLLGPRSVPRIQAPPLDVDPKSIWFESAYERAVEHIRELYEAEGFLDARVGPARLQIVAAADARPSADPRARRTRAIVEVPVVEGPRTMLHGLELRGERALDARTIAEASRLVDGQPFSYLALERAKGRIEALYRDRGYFYARLTSEVRFSRDRTRATVLLRIEERYEVHVGEILVRGATQTRERLIRRMIPMAEGDLLTPGILRATQERLLALGVFNGVNVAPQDEDLPGVVKPIEITISERRPQYIDFRAGISTGQGLRFGAEYGYRNLFGTGLSLTLGARFGYQFIFLDEIVERRYKALALEDRLERRVNVTLGIPYIGLPNVRASLTVAHIRENARNFGMDRNAIDLSFWWRPIRPLSFQWINGVENNDVDILDGLDYQRLLEEVVDNVRLRNLLRVPEGSSTLIASQLVVGLDRRDNPFNPTRGYLLTGSAEWARTLRTEVITNAMGEETQFFSHHLRIQGSASGYVPLGAQKRFVVAMQLKLGRVIHLERGSDTYPNRQFYLGGVDTIRGYLQDALIPQDVADELARDPDLSAGPRGAIQGGDVFMVLRGELRFPITSSLSGGAFVDLGNSWRDARPGTLEPWNLRPTAGLGLRIGTPVGPISLDYGILLLRREELAEPFGSFHFSIGLF
ncbi:MAG: BamA/TamA family outer membrane protein [Myxococcales bacterium]|nr:BamA/TamA family outer membrane protein [Myxococcales bacterium]